MSCPVIGTTNDVLPPNHPSIDLAKDGQVVRTQDSTGSGCTLLT